MAHVQELESKLSGKSNEITQLQTQIASATRDHEKRLAEKGEEIAKLAKDMQKAQTDTEQRLQQVQKSMTDELSLKQKEIEINEKKQLEQLDRIMKLQEDLTKANNLVQSHAA